MISNEVKEIIVETFTTLRDESVKATKSLISSDGTPLSIVEETMKKTDKYNKVLNELTGKEKQ